LKGIILAGGSGTRLFPITKGISKQLIPIYDKPMIYYPLSTLISAGIKEILIISTPKDLPVFKQLLGNGSKLGLSFSYKEQPKPEGLAQAFILGKDFIANDDVCLILGDNIFYGSDLKKSINTAIKRVKESDKAGIFGYNVQDPERYGVAEIDNNNNVISLEEKPKLPKSNYAVIGLYCYPNDVVKKVKNITPSKRGELEITSLNNHYLNDQRLTMEILENENIHWIDTGTQKTLIEASSLVYTIESRTNKKIGCIEEQSYLAGNISLKTLKEISKDYGENEYAEYLKKI
jgi:glucose-1-phosphate thymidylyltransferase